MDAALERVAGSVRAAQASGTPLRIRGGGSKDFYGGPLAGALLDLGELRGISSYEPTEMVITARAGTPLAELEAALAEKGQCLAFEPPRFGAGATVGGMVAAGIAGPARASVGGVRDFVLGATIMDGQGQLLQFGGQVMKNVAGYDLSRVLAGSLGVLGVIVEVSLKVPPVAAARQTLVLAIEQKPAIDLVQQWTTQAVPIRASAWQAGTLHVRLEGAQAAVTTYAARLANSNGAKPLPEGEAATFWNEMRDQRSRFFLEPPAASSAPAAPAAAVVAVGDAPVARPRCAARCPLWRLSVPATYPPLELDGPTLIEWGGAQRWLYSDAPADHIRAAATRAGGHATAYRDAADRTDVFTPLAAPLAAIHRNLKAAFDPAGIFNPGRLYPWL